MTILSRVPPVALLLLTLSLSACGPFDVSVNDRTVFTPRPLFKDYNIPDPALASCVGDAIASQLATSASELRSLVCRDAGVSSVAGLETFTALDRIDLRDNAIQDIGPLAAVSAVQTLLLSDNDIVNPVPLYRMTALAQLELEGNGRLLCPDRAALIGVEVLGLPRHCGR
ncbi:MAG: hypothetical protein AAGI11_03775 [Pseudomonadota bacterium]